LDVSSAYERKDVAFVFLNLAYFAYHDDLEFHLFTCNYLPSLWFNNTPLHGVGGRWMEKIKEGEYGCCVLYPCMKIEQ
jgi:hypothetical protein